MASFRITYANATTDKVDVIEADEYVADDKWVVFSQLRPNGTTVVTLSVRFDKVVKIERVNPEATPSARRRAC